jgi:hypothetical protein
VDFFGVAAEARVHVILFIVLTGSWVAAQKWLMSFYFTRLVYLQHPLWVKHTAPLLNAPWFIRARTTYNEIYAQIFTAREQAQEEFAGGGPWGEQYQQQEQSRQSNADDNRMTYERALEIMELSEGATVQDVREAHKRLMQRVHPDVGGSNFFAKQLNAAREVLLERFKKK